MFLTEEHEKIRFFNPLSHFFHLELSDKENKAYLNGEHMTECNIYLTLPIVQFIIQFFQRGNSMYHSFVRFIDVEENIIVVEEEIKNSSKKRER